MPAAIFTARPRRGGTANQGVAYKLDASGNETVLHSFIGRPDARDPVWGLARDASGDLYGATAEDASPPNPGGMSEWATNGLGIETCTLTHVVPKTARF